ncbi:MAG: sensor histidine kinase [Rikenellaceae bacterium]
MNSQNINWRIIHVMWIEWSIVGIVSMINRIILMPNLFFAKQYSKYIIALSTLFILLSIFIFYFDGINVILSIFGENPLNTSKPIRHEALAHRVDALPHGISHQSGPPVVSIIPPALGVIILAFIVIALDMGLSIAIRWIISEQKQSEIKKERINAQLSNLQSQVSPHFFMNTLNNIHALVDIDSERAKQTIIELSELMNYLLYESSNKERVSLHQELEFIESYINLMRLRYPKRVVTNFSYNKDAPQVKIPPLLFLNFIENAFKYGVDYSQESFINIDFYINDSEINMTTINSNHSEVINSSKHRLGHGLGISNSRKRLRLLYGDRYSLKLEDKEGVYYVTLKIPIE